MTSPDDRQLAGTVGKTYLAYNKEVAKCLAIPAYFTDVCSVASPGNIFYSEKFKQKLPSPEESLDSSSSLLCVAKRTMCRNNAEKSENLSSIQKQRPFEPPPDENTDHCESPEKNKTMCNASSNNCPSVISTQNSPIASSPKSTRYNLNTFLSLESNFREFQFREKNLQFNNCNLSNINNQISMGNSVGKSPISTSGSEAEILGRQASPIDPPTIDVIDLSDDEPILSLNLPEQEHNSSSLDIKIVLQEPLASERLMPQLSPVDSDASVVESVKVMEVISLPSSPEMPTLIPFIMETKESLKESSSSVSDNESNSSQRRSFCDALAKNLQPKVILGRICLENCFTAQKKYKVSALEKHCASVMQKRKQDKTPCKLSDIDLIDGLNFFSFSSKPEMERYCKENNDNVLFNIKENVEEGKFKFKEDLDVEKFDKTGSKNKFHIAENTIKDKLSLSQSSIIIPTKTTNVTQIKGWKNKHFSSESEFTSVFEDSSREESGLYESKSESMLLEGTSNMPSDVLHANSAEKKIIMAEKTIVVLSPKLFNISSGTVIRKFPTGVQGIFSSNALDEFLEKDAELHVKLLQKVNPNIIPIPLDNPILSLGKLRKSDDFENQMSQRSFMRLKNSLTPKSSSEPENNLIHNLIKHGTKLSPPSPILNNKKDLQIYAAANAKRKFDGMHKSLKKAKLCKNRAGIERLMLRLKKKYSGFSDEYEVDSVNKNSKAKSNMSSFKQENKSFDKNQLVVIKETSFSQNEEERNEKVVLDKFLRNFNSYGTTTGLVDMLFASSGSIFSDNEVLEPNLFTSTTSIETLLNAKYSNARIRPKKIRFSSTQLLTTKSAILDPDIVKIKEDSDIASVKEESASIDEVEDESSSEDEERESESPSEDEESESESPSEDEESESESSSEDEGIESKSLSEETNESFTSDENFGEESTSNDGVDEKLISNDLERVNCRNESNKTCSFRKPAHENKALLRNKRNTRMPKRLLDSAILSPGSEWVSSTLIKEKNTPRLVSRKRPAELNKHDLEHRPNMNPAKVTKIDTSNKLSMLTEEWVHGSNNAASGNKKPTDSAPLVKNTKRITKNHSCFCHNSTQTMVSYTALKRLTCRRRLTAFANPDSSGVDLTTVSLQNSREEVENITHDFTRSTTSPSSWMPESYKEMELDSYAELPPQRMGHSVLPVPSSLLEMNPYLRSFSKHLSAVHPFNKHYKKTIGDGSRYKTDFSNGEFQQVSRPAVEQTINGNFNTNSQYSTHCRIPLQNDMDVDQTIDTTSLKPGKSDEALLEDFTNLTEIVEEPVIVS